MENFEKSIKEFNLDFIKNNGVINQELFDVMYRDIMDYYSPSMGKFFLFLTRETIEKLIFKKFNFYQEITRSDMFRKIFNISYLVQYIVYRKYRSTKIKEYREKFNKYKQECGESPCDSCGYDNGLTYHHTPSDYNLLYAYIVDDGVLNFSCQNKYDSDDHRGFNLYLEYVE